MRTSREEWEKRVKRWKDSGLTAAEFSAELGINARTLTYWKWRLGKEAQPGVSRKPSGCSKSDKRKRRVRAKPKFVEVKPALALPRLELVVGERWVVRVPDGFEVETLRRVVSALDAQRDRS